MTTADLTYKPHIDGLRAIAVTAVILFHLYPSYFTGGYLGVDIFFVISGFVITQSLMKDYLETGTVHIFGFYIKRFKRLYPALVTMVLGTSAAYVFFGFLWDTNLYLKSALTSILASSNIYFVFKGDDYFLQDLINPLVHTWSLGVEEQFYFIYPFLLAALLLVFVGLRIRLIFISLVFLAVSTLLYVLFSLHQDSLLGAFYFPLARFWELGAGCALFFFSQYFPFTRFSSALATIAAAALMSVLAFQSHIDSLPLETLFAVLATATVLYAGIGSTGLVTRFLQHNVMTYIGRISYSLYLWHLPVIYFSFLYLDTFAATVVATSGSIVLAMISYHWVEKPLRYSRSLDAMVLSMVRTGPYVIAGLILVVLLFGQGTVRNTINTGFNAFSHHIKSLNYIESNFNLGARIQPNHTLEGRSMSVCTEVATMDQLPVNEIGLHPACLKQVDNDRLFYLTGDSHAFHFLSAFDNASVVSNLYMVEIPRQSIVSEDPALYDAKAATALLTKQEKELQKLTKEFEEVYYVTSFFLSPWDSQLATTKERLTAYLEALSQHAPLIFIAPTPLFPTGPESCVLLGKHCTISKSADIERLTPTKNMLQEFADTYSNVYIYDPYEAICPNDQCVNYDAENDFLNYMDQDHLSVESSILLAPHFDAWFEKTLNQN